MVSIGKRVAAYLIDLVMVLLLLYVIVIPVIAVVSAFTGAREYGEFQEFTATNVLVIIIFFYYGHPLKKSGQTVGEKIMKIKVVPQKGEKIGIFSALVRWAFFAPIMAVLGLFSLPLKDGSKRSILEVASRTRIEAV